MLNPNIIEEIGVSYDDYLKDMNDKYRQGWIDKYDKIEITPAQREILASPSREMNIVVFAAGWCPDCKAACPILKIMEDLSNYIDLTLIDKDQHSDKMKDYHTNGGPRIPLVLFMNDEFEELDRWVERSKFGYQLLLEAKLQALDQDTENYNEIKRDKFRNYSQKMFVENQKELFSRLDRARTLLNAGSSLQDLPKNLTSQLM